MEKYGDLISKGPECKVPDITAEDVYEVLTRSKPSAAGLDAWEPAEMRLLSKKTCSQIARLYNLIEAG